MQLYIAKQLPINLNMYFYMIKIVCIIEVYYLLIYYFISLFVYLFITLFV